MTTLETKRLMNLRALRQQRGLTLRGLAGLLGVKHVAVHRWEMGHCMPDADRLPQIADALGCTIDALFGREPAVVDPAS